MNAVKAMVMSETHPRLSISQSPTLYNAAFSSWIAPGSFVIGVLLAIEPANTITERARWEAAPVGGCEGWSVRGLGYGTAPPLMPLCAVETAPGCPPSRSADS